MPWHGGARYSLSDTVVNSSCVPNSPPNYILSVTAKEGKLAHPVHHHCSSEDTLLYGGSMYKHVIPLQPELIIPKEIPHQLRTRVFEHRSAPVLRRSTLRIPTPRLIGHGRGRTVHHLNPCPPSVFFLNQLPQMQQIVFRHHRTPTRVFLTRGGTGGGVGKSGVVLGIGRARRAKLEKSVFGVKGPFGLPRPAHDDADDNRNP